MIIGFIGFGKVAQNLAGIIESDDINFITSAESRSPETVENIKNSNVEVLDTFRQVASRSDIILRILCR